MAVEALQEDRTDLERSVRRCHVNLGHPSKERFLHMLRSARASNRAIDIAKKLKCSMCESHKPCPSHAVSKHKRAEGFNQQLNMDTFEVEIFQEKKLKMLNLWELGFKFAHPCGREPMRKRSEEPIVSIGKGGLVTRLKCLRMEGPS